MQGGEEPEGGGGRVWAENKVKAAAHTGVKDGALVACSWLLARGIVVTGFWAEMGGEERRSHQRKKDNTNCLFFFLVVKQQIQERKEEEEEEEKDIGAERTAFISDSKSPSKHKMR